MSAPNPKTTMKSWKPTDTNPDLYNGTQVYSYQLLFRAVEAGDLKTLRSLIQLAQKNQDFDISQVVDFEGCTLLHKACDNLNIDIVRYLLGLNANVNARNSSGWTAFHFACQRGNIEIARSLIDSKANIRSRTNQGTTPLLWACTGGCLPLVRLLVELKTDIKAVDVQGEGSLHYASTFGNLTTVKYLVEEAKTSIEDVNKSGNGSLHIAAFWHHLSTVKYLVENAKADMKAMNKHGNTPLKVTSSEEVKEYLQEAQTALNLLQAVKTENLADAQALIPKLNHHSIEKEQDEHGNTLLHFACENGDPEMVQLLLDAKASINARRKKGTTPLLIACGRGHVQVVKRLVELKADKKAADTNGDGPLHCACYNGHFEVIKFMVDTHHLDIETHNKQDRTPLDIALSEGKMDIANYFNQKRFQQAVLSGQVEEAKAILRTEYLKLDINHPTDKKGTTYLYLAFQNQNLKLSRLLLDSKASIQGHMSDGRTLLLFACSRGHLPAAKALVDHKANVKAVDNKGYGPLHLACLNGHLNMVKFLVESCKVDIKAVNEEGKTPLLVANGGGHVQVVRCLVELNADLETADSNGYKPLHLACSNRHLNLAKFLVEECKANIEAVNKQGETALSLAREGGKPDLVSYVEAATVKDVKMTKSLLVRLDKGLIRAWLLATQSTSKISKKAIDFFYTNDVDGEILEHLVSSGTDLETQCQDLNIGDRVKVRRFIRPLVNTIKQPEHKDIRGTFRRLKVFDRGDVNLKDAKDLGRGTYGYALLVSVAGFADPVVLKRNYYPVKSLKSLNAIDQMGTHHNILNIIGCVTLDHDICVVSEYCAKGSLCDLARGKKIEPSDKVLLSYAKAIANGLMHLHSRGIIHRDLRADNILMHSNGRVVIGDYGLSRKLPSTKNYYKDVSALPLPEHWMAPECLQHKKYTFKGDIWSLGVTLYELLTRGREPYAELKDWETKVRPGVIDGSIRLIDEGFGDIFERESFPVPSRMIGIAEKCLDFNEKRRPDARRVLELVEHGVNLRQASEYS
ncbi:hypothetical protein AAMO2058_001250800 [Amorphochlora amoebiformis]